MATADDAYVAFDNQTVAGRFGRVKFMSNTNGAGWVALGFGQSMGDDNADTGIVRFPPSAFSHSIGSGVFGGGNPSVEFGCLFNVNAGLIDWQTVQVLVVQS